MRTDTIPDNITENEKNMPQGVERPDESATLTVRFNHKDLPITVEEARVLAQKGLNYDKLQKRLEAIKNNPEVMRLMERRNSVSDDELSNNSENLENQTETVSENDSRNDLKERFEKELSEALGVYPELSAEDITDEVLNEFSKGVSLGGILEKRRVKSEAKMLRNRIAQLENELLILKTDKENAVSSSGSLAGSGDTVSDEVYSKDEFDSLTKEQIKRNLPKALKSMSFWSARSRK